MTVTGSVPVVALLTALTLASGCATGSSETKGGTLPPLSRVTSAQPSTPAAARDLENESRVRSAYLAYLPTYRHAQRLPATLRKPYLSRWEVDPQLSRDLEDLARDDREYYRDMGSESAHIMSIVVKGSEATVSDCLDRSGTYVVDSRSGRRLNGSKGLPRVWAITRFKDVDAHWRVYETVARRATCTNS